MDDTFIIYSDYCINCNEELLKGSRLLVLKLEWTYNNRTYSKTGLILCNNCEIDIKSISKSLQYRLKEFNVDYL